MNYAWIDEYCLSKKGAVKDYKIEWDVIRYLIKGKMFVMQGKDSSKKEILTLKCEPMFGQLLRKNYPDIIPGYYMNKLHWNSVFLEGSVPDDVLREMIGMSYELVMKSLSKKTQKEIAEENTNIF